MDTDIRTEIDRSFGDGPAVDDLPEILARGGRSLRRRRLAGAGATLAAGIVVIGGAVAVAGGGSTDHATPAPAAPSTTASASPSETAGIDATGEKSFPPPPDAPPIRDSGMPADWAVASQPDGLHISSHVRVVRVWDDPWNLRPEGAWSAAVIYRAKGVTTWYVGYVDQGRGGASASIAATDAGMGFEAWVRAQQPAGVHGDGPDEHATPEGDWPGRVDLDLVRFVGDSDRLEALPDVSLLRQRAHPDLPAAWATGADQSAAGEVRHDGERYYVLARRTADGTDAQVIAVSAEDGGPTLRAFLSLAARRYAEGGGGLL